MRARCRGLRCKWPVAAVTNAARRPFRQKRACSKVPDSGILFVRTEACVRSRIAGISGAHKVILGSLYNALMNAWCAAAASQTPLSRVCPEPPLVSIGMAMIDSTFGAAFIGLIISAWCVSLPCVLRKLY